MRVKGKEREKGDSSGYDVRQEVGSTELSSSHSKEVQSMHGLAFVLLFFVLVRSIEYAKSKTHHPSPNPPCLAIRFWAFFSAPPWVLVYVCVCICPVY